MNAEIIATQYASLQDLYDKYQFDAERIWNLDETGITPSRDIKRTQR